jgi:hypothetical protein
VGLHELADGRTALGREHLWRSARISRNANNGGEFDRKLALLAGADDPR